MARKRSHTKTNKKVLWGAITVIIVVVICVLGSTNVFVRNKLTSVFSDNVKSQKVEYKKQQSIAQKKYGTMTKVDSESNEETSASSTTSSSESNKKKSSTTSSSTETSSSSATSSSTYKSYVVESGDTLSSIANKYGTTVARLMTLNNLRTGTISTGTTLRVPTSTISSSTSSTSSSD